MLPSVIRFALSQRLLVVILTLTVALMGWFAFRELPIDAYPDISTTQVQIIVKADGMPPQEVESRVTRPLETAVRGIPRQTVLRSMTKYALTVITVDFEEGTDIYWARTQVGERIAPVLVELPDNVEAQLAPITTPLSDIYMFLVEGDGYTTMQLRDILDWNIRPKLLGVDGVADVNSLGGDVRSYRIEPRPSDLVSLGLSLTDLAEAVEKNNRNAAGDRISVRDEVVLVQTYGQLRSIDDLRQVVVAVREGRAIRLFEVADIDVAAVSRYGGVTANGKGEAVQGLVLLRRGANSRKTVEAVKSELATIRGSLPRGVRITPFYDRSMLITTAVNTVNWSLLQAIVLVLVVLFLFLGNLRSALTAGAILPLSVLGVFVIMKYTGITANLMSLGGLAIAIGILVDSSVVVTENVHNFLSTGHSALHPLHHIYRAVREVAVPVVTAVLVIVASLFPVWSLVGVEGKLFSPLAATLGFAVLVSMVLSLTFIPVLASFLMKPGAESTPWLIRKLTNAYRPALAWVLSHRKTALVFSLGLLTTAFSLFPLLGSEFLPMLNEGTIVVQTEKIPTITLEKSLELDTAIQKALLEVPEVTGVVSRTGADELRLDPMGFYQTDLYLVTKPIDQWRRPDPEWLRARLREKLGLFLGVSSGFTQPIDMRISEMLTGARAAVAIKIFGTDLAILEEKAKLVEELITGTRGAVDVMRTQLGGQKMLDIRFSAGCMACSGISQSAVNDLVSTAVAGTLVTRILQDNRPIPVVLRYPESARDTPEAIGALLVRTAAGGTQPLSEVTRIDLTEGPMQISRENGFRMVVVQANVEGRDVGGFVRELQKRIAAEVPLPAGMFVQFGGQFENQQRTSKRLGFTIPLALAAIFFLLFTSFGSLRQTILILANIPLAFVGGIVILYFTGFYL
ncbi:MAG: CusA/CzcA family heavy metal efflux RND transporter, partial [Deltaproteobacteria bacterium HGW-Deltaproteobacteria-22]